MGIQEGVLQKEKYANVSNVAHGKLLNIKFMTKDTKPRLYFTCPYKALYMQEHFNIKLMPQELFGIISNVFGTYEEGDDLKIKILPHFDKVYVAPESEEIFEPKDRDFGISSRGAIQTIYDSENGWVSVANGAWSGSIQSSKIIMRDNKQFFDALREEND